MQWSVGMLSSAVDYLLLSCTQISFLERASVCRQAAVVVVDAVVTCHAGHRWDHQYLPLHSRLQLVGMAAAAEQTLCLSLCNGPCENIAR